MHSHSAPLLLHGSLVLSASVSYHEVTARSGTLLLKVVRARGWLPSNSYPAAYHSALQFGHLSSFAYHVTRLHFRLGLVCSTSRRLAVVPGHQSHVELARTSFSATSGSLPLPRLPYRIPGSAGSYRCSWFAGGSALSFVPLVRRSSVSRPIVRFPPRVCDSALFSCSFRRLIPRP